MLPPCNLRFRNEDSRGDSDVSNFACLDPAVYSGAVNLKESSCIRNGQEVLRSNGNFNRPGLLHCCFVHCYKCSTGHIYLSRVLRVSREEIMNFVVNSAPL